MSYLLLDLKNRYRQVVKIHRYDNDTRNLKIRVTDNGLPFQLLSSYDVFLKVPVNGRPVYISGDIDEEENIARFALSHNVSLQGGNIYSEMIISNDGSIVDGELQSDTILATMHFVLSINKGTY